MPIPGADFSTWDGSPDHLRSFVEWDAYTWPFAYIKVSEGKVLDPLFKLQWSASKNRALRGTYHFFRPSVDPKESVIKTINYLGDDLGELPMALDLEVSEGLSGADVLSRAKSWMSWWEAFTNVRPIVYSSTNFLVNVCHCERYSWLANYKLWLAQYPYDKVEPASLRDYRIARVLNGEASVAVAVPEPFKRISFFQWTALGKPSQVPGYYTGSGGKEEIDLDMYMGTLQELLFEFNVNGIVEPPTGEPMTTKYEAINLYDSMALRPDHNTIGSPIERFPKGLKWHGDQLITLMDDVRNTSNAIVQKAGDQWLKVVDINGDITKTGWVAIIHLGTKYCELKENPVTPPPPPAPEPTLPSELYIGTSPTNAQLYKRTS